MQRTCSSFVTHVDVEHSVPHGVAMMILLLLIVVLLMLLLLLLLMVQPAIYLMGLQRVGAAGSPTLRLLFKRLISNRQCEFCQWQSGK